MSTTAPNCGPPGASGPTGRCWPAAHAEWGTRSASWLPDGEDIVFLSPYHTCGCDDFDHVYRVTAFQNEPPDQLVNENRQVGPPTWFAPAGTVVIPRITPDPETVKKPGELLAAAQIVTLQDVRQDGSDPATWASPS